MIVTDELRSWLTDRTAQRQAYQQANDFARSWNHGSVNRSFAQAMATQGERRAEEIAASVRELLSEDAWVERLLGDLARVAQSEPFFEPPFRHLNGDLHTGLGVYEDDHLAMALGVTRAVELAAHKNRKRGRASISFSGQVNVFRFLKSGSARLAFWEAPTITAHFTAEAAGTCVRTDVRTIADGETLIVDGRYQTFVIEHARTNLLILQALVKADRAPLSVEYDADSHEYAGCSAVDDSASRIQMITTLLRKLDCAAAFPAVAGFLDHPHFFVRWHVMRELIGLDAEAALPHLKRMAAGDPHPETRQAARATLDYLQAPRARREAA